MYKYPTASGVELLQAARWLAIFGDGHSKVPGMKGYTGVLPDGEAVHYVDKKRWFWLLSVTYPLQVFIPLWLHSATD